MLRIRWTAKMTNEDCMKKANHQRNLLKNIRKRQSSFFGHVMRRAGIENFVTTGRINGKR